LHLYPAGVSGSFPPASAPSRFSLSRPPRDGMARRLPAPARVPWPCGAAALHRWPWPSP